MNLVYDTSAYSMQRFGGVTRIYDQIIPRMLQKDEDLQITTFCDNLILREPPIGDRIVNKNIIKVANYARPWRFWRKHLPEMQRWVDRIAFQNTNSRIYHSTYFTTLPFWFGPKVITVYDMIHEMYPELKRNSHIIVPQKIKAFEFADRIISISETTKNDLIDRYQIKPEKVIPIHLGCSEEYFPKDASNLKVRIEKPFFLYVGRREGYKNFSILVQAYAKWKRNSEFSVIVVGKQWSNSEETLLSSLGVTRWFTVMENVDDASLSDLYNQALAYINTSLYEGFGLPFIEAAACNCRILSSDIPAAREIVGDLPTYFKKDSIDELVQALDLLALETKSEEFLYESKRKSSNYSWSKTAEQTLNLYKTLL